MKKAMIFFIHNPSLINIFNLFGLDIDKVRTSDFNPIDGCYGCYGYKKFLELLSPLSLLINHTIDLDELRSETNFDASHITFEMLLGFQYKKDVVFNFSREIDDSNDLICPIGEVFKKNGFSMVSFEMSEKKVIIHEHYMITDFLDEKINEICPDDYNILIR